MKRTLYFVMGLLLLTSCETINRVNISCMDPGDYSFPSQIRRVGIVNNTPKATTLAKDSSVTESANKEKRNTQSYPFAEGKLVTESLASALADQKYFDEVVICDSALRYHDTIQRQTKLTPQEVQALTDGLDVDAIISVEDVRMNASKSINYIPENNYFSGSIDLNIRPTIRVYYPNIKATSFMLSPSDSINWNEAGATTADVEQGLPTVQRMIEEASQYAGTIPIKYLVPHWVQQVRVYFSDQVKSALREASLDVQSNKWDDAYKIWQAAFDGSKNSMNRMRMAFNIATYKELQGDISDALSWLEKSRTYLRSSKKAKDPFYTSLIDSYKTILNERNAKITSLNIQMERFNTDKEEKGTNN